MYFDNVILLLILRENNFIKFLFGIIITMTKYSNYEDE